MFRPHRILANKENTYSFFMIRMHESDDLVSSQAERT
jgi:hypothetical protein